MEKDKQVRTLYSHIETREIEGKRHLTGLIPYNLKSFELYGFFEVITETAFNKTLQDRSKVFALWSHDDRRVLGNTENGTLRLSSTPQGLVCEVDLPDTTDANDLWTLVREKYVDTLSFAFIPIKAEEAVEDGTVTRYLREVKLLEVSFGVPFPAYPGTDSMARSIFEYRNIDADKLLRTLSKKEITASDAPLIKSVIRSLDELLPQEAESKVTEAEESTSAELREFHELLAELRAINK